MLRKAWLLCLIWLTMFVCEGCWDRTEVDKLAIVVGLGFDKLPGQNQYLLTAQIVNPPAFQREGGTGKERPFIVKHAQGVSVYDALRNFSLDSPRRMFFSPGSHHCDRGPDGKIGNSTLA